MLLTNASMPFSNTAEHFAPRLTFSKEFPELIIHCVSADKTPKLELIKRWKVNPEGNISEKDAIMTRRLSRWPNKKILVPFLISVLRLYQMCSNPKHITCFEILMQPWLLLKLIFSLDIVLLTVVSLALLLLTGLMGAFTPNSIQHSLFVLECS